MQLIMEVTEKEAMEIYSQRYFDSKGKRKYLSPIILVLGAVIGFFIASSVNGWLGVAIFGILVTPGMYVHLKSLRASGKYAKKQIEEVK